MGTLVIEDIDEVLMGDLAHVAAMKQVPIQVEAKRLLRDATPERNSAKLVELLDLIASMTPVGVIQSDSTVLIREDRDR